MIQLKRLDGCSMLYSLVICRPGDQIHTLNREGGKEANLPDAKW